MKGKLVSTMIAAALAGCLLPVPALAGGLEAGSLPNELTGSQPGVVSTQASKATVYVLKNAAGEKLTYNKNGFVTKRKSKTETTTYRYSGARITSFYQSVGSSSPSSVTIGYDKKGRVKKVSSSGASSYSSYIDAYAYNKKGRVSKIARKYTMMSGGYTVKYSYDKKGRVKSSVNTSGIGMKCSYSYDSRGNVTGFSAGPAKGYGFTRYIFNTYTYKNGRVAKRSQTMNGTGGAVYTSTYSYKAIRVPKKYAAKVKKQQRALLGNPNPAVVL